MASADKGPAGAAQPAQPPQTDAPGQGDMGTIRPVKLDLHGNGIGHRQDEPQPDAQRKGAR